MSIWHDITLKPTYKTRSNNELKIKSSNILINSCLKGDISEANLILSSNSVSINYFDYDTGLYPITCAVMMKNISLVKILLKYNPNVNIQYNNITLINCICSTTGYDCFEILDLLIENGANIESTDFEEAKSTPLVCACKSDNLKLVQYLIKKGANVNVLHLGYENPLVTACISPYDNVHIIQYLLNNNAIYNSMILIETCKYSDNSEIVKWLITECKIDVNRTDENGYSALYHAITEKHTKIINVLLKYISNIPENIKEIPHINADIRCKLVLQNIGNAYL